MLASVHRQGYHLSVGNDRQMALIIPNLQRIASFSFIVTLELHLRVPFTHILFIIWNLLSKLLHLPCLCGSVNLHVVLLLSVLLGYTLAQTIIELNPNVYVLICSSHRNIKTQTKDHKFFPWCQHPVSAIVDQPAPPPPLETRDIQDSNHTYTWV